MATRLIGDDSLVTVYIGNAQGPGVTPTYGASVNVKPFGTGAKKSAKTDTVQFKALGDKRKKTRVVAGQDELTLDLYIQDTGPIATGLIGYYIKVEITPLSSLVAGKQTYLGVITGQDEDYSSGKESTETLTIACDAE